jgi:CHASE2 domain-containing sensor protein
MKGEVRVRIEGGLAHFPGLAAERVVPFDRLDAPERDEIVALAGEAHFFECEPPRALAGPDARTYILFLAIDGRSREVRVAEPIADPALAKLVTKLRQVAQRVAG